MRDSEHPLVTVAIPTYNRANTYLPQALRSVISQTYTNIEILVADNCSTDNTESVVNAFKDSRIRYVKHNKNIGPFHNANFCIQEASGEFFLMLQDDDLIDHDMIETCLKAVKYACADIGVIRTGTRWIGQDGNLLKEIPNRAGGLSLDGFFLAIFAGKTPTYLCSTVFHTKRLQEIGGFRSKHCLFYDVMATVKLAAKYGREDIHDIKASNRKHASELTWSTTIQGWCEDSLDLLDMMCELASENKAVIRAEGMRALSEYNYGLTEKIASPMKRLWTYWVVFQKFQCKYLPPPVRSFVFNNPVYRGARYVKRKMTQYC